MHEWNLEKRLKTIFLWGNKWGILFNIFSWFLGTIPNQILELLTSYKQYESSNYIVKKIMSSFFILFHIRLPIQQQRIKPGVEDRSWLLRHVTEPVWVFHVSIQWTDVRYLDVFSICHLHVTVPLTSNNVFFARNITKSVLRHYTKLPKFCSKYFTGFIDC